MKNEEILKMNNGKKFDIILMNPPYSGSLHLKFLEKTIKIADKVVSIQPTRWLQDTLATYKKITDLKKYKDSIAEHINNLEFISADDAAKYFGANFTIMVGIYNCSQNKSEYYKLLTFVKDGIDYSFVKKIIEKIIEDKNYSKMNIKNWNKDLHNFIPLNNMTGENIKRCKPTNVIKEWTKPYKNGEEYEYDKKHKSGVARGKIENDRCLVFNTYEEAKNCYNSFTKCDFTRFYMSFITTDIHIYHEYMSFMEDYTKPWTDERFYKYFNINKEEQELIENYAEKIWNRLNEK